MKKMVSVTESLIHPFNTIEASIVDSPVFKGISEKYGFNGQETTLFQTLKSDLQQAEFKTTLLRESNVWELVIHSNLPHEDKSALVAILACVLKDHQIHARQGSATLPAYDWQDNQSHDTINVTHPWVNNWLHTVEEMLNLFVMTTYLGHYNPQGKEPNASLGPIAITSVLTDSKKIPSLKGVFDHHIEGANQMMKLWEVLPFSDAQKSDIYSGILEHQYCPPPIMAMIGKILLGIQKTDAVLIDSIGKKIGDPFIQPSQQVEVARYGQTVIHGNSIAFSEIELAELQKIHPGFRGWFLPTTELAKRVVQVDSLQYCGRGKDKCLASRGPQTSLGDPTLHASVRSILGTLDQEAEAEGQVYAMSSSIESCQHTFASDSEYRFLEGLKKSAVLIHNTTLESIRSNLPAEFNVLVDQMPDNGQRPTKDSNGNWQNVPYLDHALPGHFEDMKYIYDAPEQHKMLHEMGRMVQQTYIRLSQAQYRQALKDGRFYEPVKKQAATRISLAVPPVSRHRSAPVFGGASPSTYRPRASDDSLIANHKGLEAYLREISES